MDNVVLDRDQTYLELMKSMCYSLIVTDEKLKIRFNDFLLIYVPPENSFIAKYSI